MGAGATPASTGAGRSQAFSRRTAVQKGRRDNECLCLCKPCVCKRNQLICEEYAGFGKESRMGKNTTGHESLTVTSHARGQAAIVHNQLEVDHSGSLGSRKCSGRNTSTDQGSRRAPPIARACMNNELSKLVQKEAISHVLNPNPSESFISRIFLVPKKDGSQRPIVDLRDLNKSIVWEHSRWKVSIYS